MLFNELGLSEPILKAVTEAGYEKPTPIQAQAIPLVLAGKDVVGLSQITKLGKPQILVLEPTRELAHQVAEQFTAYGEHTGCKVALLFGGVGYGSQNDQLKDADINLVH